ILAKRLAIKMTERLGADGFNLVQNNNECAGQTVFHFHFHLIPRYENDGQHILWNPTKPSAEELAEVKNILTK
ncbi:MAG: HIT family protein, partial [Lachnospiraceae bacterium]|nr:HIT family protein [Lachnospiraceae bacterium]